MQEETEKKAYADIQFVLYIVKQEEILKKKELVVQKKGEREVQRAHLAPKKLAT